VVTNSNNNNNNNNNNNIAFFLRAACQSIGREKEEKTAKGKDAKNGRTKLKKCNNNRMIEVILSITKEKPNGHSYINSSVFTKAVSPKEDSFFTGVINGCNIIT
jgi:hypothetical protein